MEKWEYLLVQTLGDGVVNVNGKAPAGMLQKFFAVGGKTKVWDLLNALGEQGWEAVSLTNVGVGEGSGNNVYLLKRTKQEDKPLESRREDQLTTPGPA